MEPSIPSGTRKSYAKSFIPLESNPNVFTELAHKLGAAQSLAFQDVLSLDDPDLLAFLPRPAYALVLVFPTTEAYEKRIAEEDAKADEYSGCGDAEPVFFLKQTINNACGLYALLHAICNGEARDKIEHGSMLHHLVQEGTGLEPKERAKLLEKDKLLESAYASVATTGDTQAPEDADDEVDFHYICFVKSHQIGHLFQLDGDRKRPIDLGSMSTGDDALSDTCLSVIRDLIAEEAGNLNFSLMALVAACYSSQVHAAVHVS